MNLHVSTFSVTVKKIKKKKKKNGVYMGGKIFQFNLSRKLFLNKIRKRIQIVMHWLFGQKNVGEASQMWRSISRIPKS